MCTRLVVKCGASNSKFYNFKTQNWLKANAAPQNSKFEITNLEILFEIHACVEACDLISVAVKHQCRPLARENGVSDAAFFGLCPARMIDVRVHVGIKAVFVG